MYKGQIPPLATKDERGKKIGSIIFSKKPIIFGKENPEDITDQFEAGDEVYGMAYLQGNWEELGFDQHVKFYIHDIDDNGYTWTVYYDGLNFVPNKKTGLSTGKNTFYDLDVFASYKNAFDKTVPMEFLGALINFLGPESSKVYKQFKNHKWVIEIMANHQLVAIGTINYNITPEGVEKIKALHNTHVNAHLADFRLPESKRDDSELAEKLKKVMIKEGLKVKKILFTTEDWEVIYHQVSGAVMSRSIWANVIHTLEDGTCFYDEVQFMEQYAGNKFSGVITKAGFGTSCGAILCENI